MTNYADENRMYEDYKEGLATATRMAIRGWAILPDFPFPIQGNHQDDKDYGEELRQYEKSTLRPEK